MVWIIQSNKSLLRKHVLRKAGRLLNNTISITYNRPTLKHELKMQGILNNHFVTAWFLPQYRNTCNIDYAMTQIQKYILIPN